jgi:hypothetical protein
MTIPARTPRVPILMYHSISYCENRRFRRFTVTPERFEEQLDYLSTHGYTPLTVSDYIQRVAGAGASAASWLHLRLRGSLCAELAP